MPSYLLGTRALKALVDNAPEHDGFMRWKKAQEDNGIRNEDFFVSVISVGLLEDCLARIPNEDVAYKIGYEQNVREKKLLHFVAG